MGEEDRYCQLRYNLDESLTDADPLAAQERREAEGVPASTIWGKEKLTVWIKALRDERFRTDPLFRIVHQAAHVDGETISLSNL